MEKLILNDSTEIDIQDGASLGIITTILADYSAFLSLASKLTKENLSHVTFQSGGITSAEYYSMALTEPNFYLTVRETGIEVTFGLRERTQEELQEEEIKMAVSYLSDEKVLTVKSLVPDWKSDPVGYEYSMDNPLDLRRNHNNGLWKLKKNHAKQLGWYPGADPTLWEQIVEDHEGTLEDPIPVPDSVTTSGFTYVYGKYYVEGENIYLCKRGGVENPEEMYGQEETLYYGPAAMVGQYFEVA